MIVPKRKKHYGPAFVSERGVKQGDVMSRTIFNIMIDAVLSIKTLLSKIERNM